MKDRLVLFAHLVSRIIATHRMWCRAVVMHQYGLVKLKRMHTIISSNHNWSIRAGNATDVLRQFIRRQTLQLSSYMTYRLTIRNMPPDDIPVYVAEVMQILASIPNIWLEGHSADQFYYSLTSPNGALFQ